MYLAAPTGFLCFCLSFRIDNKSSCIHSFSLSEAQELCLALLLWEGWQELSLPYKGWSEGGGAGPELEQILVVGRVVSDCGRP